MKPAYETLDVLVECWNITLVTLRAQLLGGVVGGEGAGTPVDASSSSARAARRIAGSMSSLPTHPRTHPPREAGQSGRSLGDEETFRPRIERINPVLAAESSLAALAQSPPLSSFWHPDPRRRALI